jgi:hypothetical protein
MSDKKRGHILFLEDIMNAIEKIERYTKGLTFEALSRKWRMGFYDHPMILSSNQTQRPI